MVLCPDVAPVVDRRFVCCDLLQRSVIHHGAHRASTTIEHESMIPKKPAPDLITSAFTRVFDALWVDTGFRKRSCSGREA